MRIFITIASLVLGTQAFSANCTDFSGEWVGTCTEQPGNQTSKDEIKVVQIGCKSIGETEEQTLEFGKEYVQTETEGNQTATYNLTISLANNNKDIHTKLVASGSGQHQDGTPVTFKTNSLTIWKLVDGKIQSQTKTATQITFGGQPMDLNSTSQCVYSKK